MTVAVVPMMGLRKCGARKKQDQGEQQSFSHTSMIATDKRLIVGSGYLIDNCDLGQS